MRTRVSTLIAAFAVASAIQYQNAFAPPPAATSQCQGWCPKWTCCKLCDDPACSGCGAKRQCADEAAKTTGQAAAAAVASSAVAQVLVAPGFETGSNGYLLANGKRFTIKGINWWGMEGPARTFGGLKQRSMNGLLDFVEENGFNAIRVLVNHRGIIINGKIPAGEYDEGRTPELVNLRYLDQLELMMRKAAERRLLVMVNIHRTVATAWPGQGLWYDSDVSEADAISSWTKLAKQLCSHWNFFAADLVNEPRMASWGRGLPTDWNKAAERMGNAVLGVCPRLLIFVQGIAGEPGAEDDGGVAEGYFWGENLYGVHAAPVRLNDQSRLVYSPHTYGPGTVKQQSYFPTCSGGGCKTDKPFPQNMPAIWDRHFGFVAQQTKHAIVVGEFGGFYTGFDKQWQDAFVDYLIDRGFGAFYFGLNPDSDDSFLTVMRTLPLLPLTTRLSKHHTYLPFRLSSLNARVRLSVRKAGGLLRHDWRSNEEAKLALIKRMPGTRVASIIGEEPPSPQPPQAPPYPQPPPPSSPAPFLANSLEQRFIPPTAIGISLAPPVPDYEPAQGYASQQATQTHPIILGSAMADTDLEASQPGSGWTMNHVAAALGAALIMAAVFRYNPHLSAAVQGQLAARRKLSQAPKMARPRPREYERVAVEPLSSPPADSEADIGSRAKPEAPPPAADTTTSLSQGQNHVQQSAQRHKHGMRQCKHDGAYQCKEACARQANVGVSQRKDSGTPKCKDAGIQDCKDVGPQHCKQPLHAKGKASRSIEAAQGQPSRLSSGMQVRVVGLRNATQHNGNEGVLIAPMVSSDNGNRWNIRMLTGELLALKEVNIELSASTPSVPSMIEALEKAGEHDKAALLRSVLPDAV